MDSHYPDIFYDDYKVHIDDDGIAFLQGVGAIALHGVHSLEQLKYFSNLLVDLTRQEHIKALLYVVPAVDSAEVYKALIEADLTLRNGGVLSAIYEDIAMLGSSEKPLVALITGPCKNLSLAPALWAKYRFALPTVALGYGDAKYGILAGFGINTIFSKIGNPDLSIPFLLQKKQYLATEVVGKGLLAGVAADFEALVHKGKTFILNAAQQQVQPQQHKLLDSQLDELHRLSKHYANNMPKGLLYAIESMQFSSIHSLDESLTLERQWYQKLWSDPRTVAYLRTQYFGVKQAIQQASDIRLPHYKLQRLGVLGAGMMGAGIAFEAAKAGVNVILKDTSFERAAQGKAYAVAVSTKWVQQGRICAEEQQQLLARIQPTADIADFDTVDLIIEAVNEDKALKGRVSAESAPYLSKAGFFASNTTSIPISELANTLAEPHKFIGMHFFSPVDKMPLLEIIKGDATTADTLHKSLLVAAKLGKVPIVVHDGPAFFTSRIFFNYLLEAIIMLLEGVDPHHIEQQAKSAGFGASPLAILDEISIPLMLQVYSQLPEMHAAQRRAFSLLTEMVAEGRLGRKSNAGFYTYTTEGKALWANPQLQVTAAVAPEVIQKRLLCVVALDSYRCLEAGIVHQPIDADLGAVLGLGFPASTGGVISYIDLLGIQSFVHTCKEFESYGEQWKLTEKLEILAQKNFKFYTGLTANWK